MQERPACNEALCRIKCTSKLKRPMTANVVVGSPIRNQSSSEYCRAIKTIPKVDSQLRDRLQQQGRELITGVHLQLVITPVSAAIATHSECHLSRSVG